MKVQEFPRRLRQLGDCMDAAGLPDEAGELRKMSKRVEGLLGWSATLSGRAKTLADGIGEYVSGNKSLDELAEFNRIYCEGARCDVLEFEAFTELE